VERVPTTVFVVFSSASRPPPIPRGKKKTPPVYKKAKKGDPPKNSPKIREKNSTWKPKKEKGSPTLKFPPVTLIFEGDPPFLPLTPPAFFPFQTQSGIPNSFWKKRFGPHRFNQNPLMPKFNPQILPSQNIAQSPK